MQHRCWNAGKSAWMEIPLKLRSLMVKIRLKPNGTRMIVVCIPFSLWMLLNGVAESVVVLWKLGDSTDMLKLAQKFDCFLVTVVFNITIMLS
ncbi:hypothetical protein AKJ16_DCAP13807 [Drosera capensis]